MGLQTKKKLRLIVGTLKDKAFLLSSAASTLPEAYAAVLRATPHHPSSQPTPRHHLDALLSFGRGSRPTAAAAVTALLSRLRGTGDAAVALKCLALAHHAARRGSFILRDQLLCLLLQPPSGGARNPLNLCAFRDAASASAWALSAWVRWYARVLELLFSSYRAIGFFPNDWSREASPGQEEERAASLPNGDLLSEIDALVDLLEEVHRGPDQTAAPGNGLVEEVVRRVQEDAAAAEREITARMTEMGQRMSCLAFGETVELSCLLKRLEDCQREKAKVSGQLWEVTKEVKQKVGVAVAAAAMKEEKRQRRGALGAVRRDMGSESARLGGRMGLLSPADSVRFASTRWSDR